MAKSPLNILIPVRLGSVLVTVALGSALGITQAPAASPTGQIIGYAGKCVDVSGAQNANGTPVQLYDCNGTAAQEWTIASDGSLRSLGKCLDVTGGTTDDGTPVQLYGCNGTGAQKWVVNAAHDIVNVRADKCLDVTDLNPANGTQLQIWSCSGRSNQKWWAAGGATTPPSGGGTSPSGGGTAPSTGGSGTPSTGGGTSPSEGFVVSESQFNQMFPNRNGFYTYSGLVDALSAYPGFAKTGNDAVRKQEVAAFLADVSHETGGLVYATEQNTANYPSYCDGNQSYGCPAGQSAYYGRGPLQLSWNTNYKAAGDALGIDLLHNPDLVQNDPAVAWETALWFWNTQNGAGYMTAHDAMVNGSRFGETVRSINGSLECNGGNPAQVQSRIDAYQRFTQILDTTAGDNHWC